MEEQKSKKKFWTKEKVIFGASVVAGFSIGIGIYSMGYTMGVKDTDNKMIAGIDAIFRNNPGFYEMMNVAIHEPRNWTTVSEEC